MKTSIELSPLDEMLGIMLEKWNQRYTFKHDRESKKIEFNRGDINISAEETDDGRIRVTIFESEQFFTRDGAPDDSARAIEAVILTEDENRNEPKIVKPSKSWWKFWK